ncbi:MAG: T9SS type A sorting domain-containing protein, partial [Bacteroidota bacterium]
RFNWWGAATTAEMDAGGNPKNIGAIFDGYDRAGVALVDYSGWLAEAALPVELASFDARADGLNAHLEWATVSETNNAGFDVEHQAPDQAQWQRLAFVEGQGTTLDAQRYTYTAPSLDPGTHRFRLKQLDYDGSFEYSAEVEVTVELTSSYVLSAVYPNPFNPSAQFSLSVRAAQVVEVGVYDLVGRRVALLHNGLLNPGRVHRFMLDAVGWPSGVYVVRVTGERFRALETVTLIK